MRAEYDTTTNRNGDTEYVPDMGICHLYPAIFENLICGTMLEI